LSDQPINIAHLVHTLDVAFEFVEVRTGPWAFKPILSSGKTPTGTLEAFQEEVNAVLDELQSEVGLRKAANARKHQQLLAEAWGADGPARKDFNELIQRYGL
jgi:small nuclear ribonucleoprotein (snRNP)-like protein